MFILQLYKNSEKNFHQGRNTYDGTLRVKYTFRCKIVIWRKSIAPTASRAKLQIAEVDVILPEAYHFSVYYTEEPLVCDSWVYVSDSRQLLGICEISRGRKPAVFLWCCHYREFRREYSVAAKADRTRSFRWKFNTMVISTPGLISIWLLHVTNVRARLRESELELGGLFLSWHVVPKNEMPILRDVAIRLAELIKGVKCAREIGFFSRVQRLSRTETCERER